MQIIQTRMQSPRALVPLSQNSSLTGVRRFRPSSSRSCGTLSDATYYFALRGVCCCPKDDAVPPPQRVNTDNFPSSNLPMPWLCFGASHATSDVQSWNGVLCSTLPTKNMRKFEKSAFLPIWATTPRSHPEFPLQALHMHATLTRTRPLLCNARLRQNTSVDARRPVFSVMRSRFEASVARFTYAVPLCIAQDVSSLRHDFARGRNRALLNDELFAASRWRSCVKRRAGRCPTPCRGRVWHSCRLLFSPRLINTKIRKVRELSF
jgi:hypothetical protein